MIKREEMSDATSCLNRAAEDEMLFVLRGHDPAAPTTILSWIKERVRLGKNQPGDAQLMEASECAILMAAGRNGQEPPKRRHRRKEPAP